MILIKERLNFKYELLLAAKIQDCLCRPQKESQILNQISSIWSQTSFKRITALVLFGFQGSAILLTCVACSARRYLPKAKRQVNLTNARKGRNRAFLHVLRILDLPNVTLLNMPSVRIKSPNDLFGSEASREQAHSSTMPIPDGF